MDLYKEAPGFRLDGETGCFTLRGVDVIAFEDIYPEGHQGGISLLMHNERIAANGDVRFEPAPGQWQPVPKQMERIVSPDLGRIVTRLRYPDMERHLRGFNPSVYPDCAFEYTVTALAEGSSIRITVDADSSLPPVWAERLCFNLELFPGLLFGKSWILDDRQGIFPRQPSGPVERRTSVYENRLPTPSGAPEGYAERLMESASAFSPLRGDEETAAPYASGRCFTACPENPLLRFTVESLGAPLRFMDGRLNHNNGWFVLSSPFSPTGTHAVEWLLTLNAAELYLSTGESVYADAILREQDLITSEPARLGWIAARVVLRLKNESFTAALRESMLHYRQQEEDTANRSPYRVPYRPYIWGAGWEIQRLGCEHYWLYRAFPDIFTPDLCSDALSFVLGCHPGRGVSFASGIGAESTTMAYGFNRADFSYIPGGVVSGTALIRPDFPELKEWPFLWQQTEYVLGGGSSRFMFLVLAVRAMAAES